MSHPTRSAAILAGGQATRFGGRDKSTLLVEGRTIRDRQIAALTPLTDDLQIVASDLVPGCGPLGGLHTALTAARHERLLLIAGDMPFVTTAFLDYLLSLTAGADLVVPQSERGYHPLCAVYTRACLEPAAARLADRRLQMRELLDSVRTRAVPLEEIRQFGNPDRLLANVNTPADYAGLEALQGHKL